MNNLYVFIDESGNFDFSSSGTRHFVFAANITTHPLKSSTPLQKLKYKLLSDGYNIESFHASPDKQAVRDQVFEVINSLEDIKLHYIWADKRKTHPKYQNPPEIYGLFGKALLKYIFNSKLAEQHDQIIVVFDQALTNKEEKAFLKVVKPELKKTGKPYRIYFHGTKSDFNGQIADYAAWAMYVSLERDENRPLAAMKNIPYSQFNIFRKGNKFYYNK